VKREVGLGWLDLSHSGSPSLRYGAASPVKAGQGCMSNIKITKQTQIVPVNITFREKNKPNLAGFQGPNRTESR
jgi:hypothetical protein